MRLQYELWQLQWYQVEKQISLVTLESDYQDLKVSLTTSLMFASEIILHIVQSPYASLSHL